MNLVCRLIWHLTGEFKGYFTSAHLRKLNAGWRQQGGGYDDSVIELIIKLLRRNDLHYEQLFLDVCKPFLGGPVSHWLNNTVTCTCAWLRWCIYYYTIASLGVSLTFVEVFHHLDASKNLANSPPF